MPHDLHTSMAMMAAPMLNHRARGLIAIRNDGGNNATEILNELKRTFEAFKEANNKEIADLKKGMGDVVQTEKVDRINAEITKLQAAIDETNVMLAALKVGGGGDAEDPAKKEYATAFNKFFRRGVEAGLNDLAVKASMKTDSDPDGGYVVPDQMESTIDRVLSTVSAMRGLARVISISSSVYKKLVNQGGASGGWVGERESRSETNTPTLSALDFPAMELYANPAATQTLLDDAAVDIAAWLADEVSITFAEMEGAAFISGDGVNKPRGLLSYNTVANASYAWGKLGFIATGVAADINDGTHNGVDALIDLVYSLKQGYRQNASFLMNRTLQSKVRKLKTIGADAQYLWQPPIQAGQPASLLGYPVADDDNMSDVGANAFPVAFGDFQRGYLIVDRMGIRVLRDPFTNKPYVMFYTTKRVGGGVQNFEAIKLLKCA
ncbi:MAG: phage major capsid protein [Mesorhizobium sp.]|nr:MAG: phage major capsid protein [Mesorhizobium sp.]